MYHSDLREEIRFLTARLLYKTKKLDEAMAAADSEKAAILQGQILEIEEKIQVCQAEAAAQEEYKANDGSKDDKNVPA